MIHQGAADITPPKTVATHYLKEGETPCSMATEYGAPVTWPHGHVYSQRWQDVTCPDCLAAKPAEQTEV